MGPPHASEMYSGTANHPALSQLAARQNGVLRRNQLGAIGVPYKYAARQIAAGRWSAWGNNVLLLTNAAPSREQLKRIALLDASGISALASHSALEQAGFQGFAKEANLLHILVTRGATYCGLPGVVHHESRRFEDENVVAIRGLDATRPARSAIDAGAWQRWPRFACATLAAVVQQRLATVEQLGQALIAAGAVRHRRQMRLALQDISDGAQAVGEIEVAKLCRRFHLQAPNRQRVRRDSAGCLRYLDCEWELSDGSIVVLEIDGSHHLAVEHWQADMKRERQVVISRRWVLRASNYELRYEQAELARDLIAIGVPVVRAA